MRLAALSVAGTIALTSSSASAWWVVDPVHKSCHERISAAALSDVGYVRSPPPLSREDADLRAGLQFDASPYDANIYALPGSGESHRWAGRTMIDMHSRD